MKVEGKIEVIDIIKEKNRVVLNTTVTKVESKRVAISGEALILFDKLRVSV